MYRKLQDLRRLPQVAEKGREVGTRWEERLSTDTDGIQVAQWGSGVLTNCFLFLTMLANFTGERKSFSSRILTGSLTRLWRTHVYGKKLFYLLFRWYSRYQAFPFITFCIVIMLRRRLYMRLFIFCFSFCVLANTLLGIIKYISQYFWPCLCNVYWLWISINTYAEHMSNGGSSKQDFQKPSPCSLCNKAPGVWKFGLTRVWQVIDTATLIRGLPEVVRWIVLRMWKYVYFWGQDVWK